MAGSYSGARGDTSGHPPHSGTGRVNTSRSPVVTSASWALVVVAILLIAILTYYLTLTTRPEISELSPIPNSSPSPGVVELEARVTSQRAITDAQFYVDGIEVETAFEQISDGQWLVSHEDVFERGDREVLLHVTDSSGRSSEHSWTFQSGGDLIEPRMVLSSPPSDVYLSPGRNGITIQVTTFAGIDQVKIRFNDEEVEPSIEAIEAGSEYSHQDNLDVFDWEIQAASTIETGPLNIRAQVIDEFGAEAVAEWNIRIALSDDTANARFFEQTGEYVVEPFLSYWKENDGNTSIGPPVGPAFSEGDGELRQFFRYARLELDSEENVNRGLIGREMFGDPELPPDRAPGSGARQFDATGHYIRGTLRDFWEDNGGLGTFGYPISQEFETDQGYAQYFERALIEVIVLGNYEIVELAPLGERLYEEYRFDPDYGADDD
jgi:hypothetical protein